MMSGQAGTKRQHGELDSEETTSAASKQQRTLPPALAKRMSEWQRDMDTVEDRDMFILREEMFTDCVFSVLGVDGQLVEVKCHRLFLAKTSPVLSSMFFGELKRDPEEVINLPDVHFEAFNAMLEYIYTGSIDLASYSYKVVCDLLYVCKKYLLPGTLLGQIYGHLWRNIYPDNMWTAIEFAENNDEPHLEQVAWEVVELSTKAALHAENFVHISENNLDHLVNNYHLNCTEEQLFSALYRWGLCKANSTSLEPTPENMKHILTDVIPKIRFLAMDGRKFAKQVMKTKIFSDSEAVPILTNLHAPYSIPMPENLCKMIHPRKQQDLDSFFVYGHPGFEIKVCDIFDINNTNHIYVKADVMLKKLEQIVGIQIPYQIKDDFNQGDETYEEFLTIILYDAEDKNVVDVREHRATVKYGTLSKRISIKSMTIRQTHAYFGVCILFHKTGWYPAEWRTNEAPIERSKVKPLVDKIHTMHFRYVRNIFIESPGTGVAAAI